MNEPISVDVDGFDDGLTGMEHVDRGPMHDIPHALVDADGDGFPDHIMVADVDGDGDGIADAEIWLGLDGDCAIDMLTSPDLAESIWGDDSLVPMDIDTNDPYEALSGTCQDYDFPGYAALCEVHGTPLEDMALWDPQDGEKSCAVATTNMLFRSVGLNPGEEAIANVFRDVDIYDPLIGTFRPEDIAHTINDVAALAHMPVHCEHIRGFTINQLEQWLDAGIRPLVAVDSADLESETLTLNELVGIPDAGHAIQVTGIVHSETGNYVYVNDPGNYGGEGRRIPLDRCLDAARDCKFDATIMRRV